MPSSRASLALVGLSASLLTAPVLYADDTGAAGGSEQVASAKATPADETNQPADTNTATLDAVVVTATRAPTRLVDVPASVTAENFADLRKTGFVTPADEFRTVPGLSFRRDAGGNEDFLSVNFRGVTGNHGNDTFLALIDGIPFLSPDEEVNLFQVPYSAVGRIEVVRGPISALYGRGALGGAVNYLTRVPDQTGVALEGSIGTYGFGRGALSATHGGDTIKNIFNVEYETAEGWRQNNQRHGISFFDKAIFDFQSKAMLTLWGMHVDRDYRLGGVIPTTPDGQLAPVTGGREAYFGIPGAGRHLNNWMAAGRLECPLTENIDWTTTLSYRREKTVGAVNFTDTGHYDVSANTASVIGFDQTKSAQTEYAESVLRWSMDRSTLTLGVSYEHAAQDDLEGYRGYYGFSLVTYQFYYYANPINYVTGEFLPVPGVSYFQGDTLHSNSDQDSAAIFAQEEWRLTDRLTITLGGRYDHFSRDVHFLPMPTAPEAAQADGANGRFTPKASIGYKFEPGLLYVTYGQGYSSNYAETWQWDPRTYARQVRPSTLDSVEVGWKGRAFDDHLDYSAAAFDLHQKDRLIFFNPVAGQPGVATNGPPYNSHGLEATAALRITPTTFISGNYSYVRAKFGNSQEYEEQRLLDPSLDDVAGHLPVGVPAHNVSLRLDQQLFGDIVDLSVLWEYHGDYPISIDNGRRGGAYDLVNLGVTVRLPGTPNLEVQGTVSNLLDKTYNFYFGRASDVAYAVPGNPREARLTLRCRF